MGGFLKSNFLKKVCFSCFRISLEVFFGVRQSALLSQPQDDTVSVCMYEIVRESEFLQRFAEIRKRNQKFSESYDQSDCILPHQYSLCHAHVHYGHRFINTHVVSCMSELLKCAYGCTYINSLCLLGNPFWYLYMDHKRGGIFLYVGTINS